MAKVGQGDPRWLVSNRADGQNVGDWHWKESDLTPWAKQTLTSRLADLALVESDAVRVVVTKASGFDGDVTVSTRKGRKIFFYDLAIDLEWKGEFLAAPADGAPAFSCTGKIHLSDIEQDSRVEDFQFKLSVAGAESEHHKTVKELVRTKGMAAIGDVIAKFNTELRHHAGVASEGAPPTAATPAAVDKPADSAASAAASDAANASTASSVVATESVALSSGTTIKTATVKLTQTFRCRPRDIVDALTDPGRVRGFTQDASAVVCSKAGDPFKLYDGTVSGTLVAVAEDKLSLDWRLREWPRDHFARIDMKMSFANDQTTLEFVASRVPATEKDNLGRAFDHYYWSRIKHVFGYGA